LNADQTHALQAKREFMWKAFKALQFNRVPGAYAEFGCHGAMTFRLAFQQSRARGEGRPFWAFDSFEGLPPNGDPKDSHPRWQKGTLATSLDGFKKLCGQAGMQPDRDYHCVPGFFSETLTAEQNPQAIAFAYIDCDLYTSTMDVLRFLEPRLRPGMIIAFDDYFCWNTRTGRSGERQALHEIRGDWEQRGFLLDRFVQYGWSGQSFVVTKPA